jgi:centrosomal protein CEP104
MAVLQYIELPLNSRHIGKSQNLFLACVEMARLISEDKILEIYFIGLRIISTCLAPPVCGNEIPV